MAQSWRFFPVVGKRPALEGDWRLHATDDPVQLDAWLAQGLGLALDCEASGVTVIDPDADKITREPIGDRELAAMPALPETYAVATPGGGRHLYFVDPDGCHGRDLAQHVNVRSRGGYVVFDDGRGGYKLVKDLPLAPLPAWVRERVAERATVRAKALAETPLDTPEHKRRAEEMLAALPVAVEGAGGDNWTYQVINKVFDVAALSSAGCLDAMLEWNERCDPPWDEDELRTKIENALEYRQNDVGAWAVAPLAERFSAALDRVGAAGGEGSDTPKPSPFRFYAEGEQDAFEPLKMLVPDLIPEGALVMFYGKPGSLKSFLTLHYALDLAAEGHGVAYIAGERALSMGGRHRPAWRDHHKVEGPLPFVLGRRVPLLSQIDQVKACVAEIKRHGPIDFLAVDTLARGMAGMKENDAGDIGIVVDALEYMRDALRCAVLAVHHQSDKDESGLPRGSSALIGAFDALHRIERDRRTQIVKLSTYLLKDGEERERPWYFKAKPHMHSLVLDPATPEDAERAKEGGISVGAVLAILQRVSKPMSTQALASELYQGPQDEDPSVTVARRGEMRGALDVAGRKDPALAPYTQGRGHERVWRLPS